MDTKEYNGRLKAARAKGKGAELCEGLFAIGQGAARSAGMSDADALKWLAGRLLFFMGDSEKAQKAYSSAVITKQQSRQEDSVLPFSQAVVEWSKSQEVYDYIPPTEKPREFLSIELLREYLSSTGRTAYIDEIRNSVVVMNGNAESSIESLSTIVHSELAGVYKGVSFQAIERYLMQIAFENRKNPVLEYIDGIQYDGCDYVTLLYSLLGLDRDDAAVERVLLRKWLYQCYAMLHNGDNGKYYGAEFILVLQGKQGGCKTSFFRHLAMMGVDHHWFAEGSEIDDRDKDTVRRVMCTFIAELGEFGRTVSKAGNDKLKQLITKAKDVYRVPYGREDSEHPRKASWCATINEESFLTDDANRRYFIIPDVCMEYGDLDALNPEQLWAQVRDEVNAAITDGASYASVFRLTPDEMQWIIAGNVKYASLPFDDEITAIIDRSKSANHVMKRLTSGEFYLMHKHELPSQCTARSVSKVLKSKPELDGKKTKITDETRFRFLIPVAIVSE